MDDHAADVLGGDDIRMALDLGELEAVGRVPRLEHLAIQTGCDDLVDLPGRELLARCEVERLEVLHVDGAVRSEALPMGQAHPRALGTQALQPYPPVAVLAEVDHRRPPDVGDRNRFELLDPPGRWRRRGGEPIEVVVDHLHGVHRTGLSRWSSR